MKRILFAFCLVCTAVLLALPSCRKVETPVPEEGEIVAFDIKVVYDAGPATRVVKTEWEVGDKLFLFFLRNSGHYLSNNNYATLTYNGSTWDVSTNVPFTWSNGFNGSGTMYAVYFPFGNVVHPGSENFRCSGYDNAAMNTIPPFSWYMIDEGSPFTVTAAVPNNLNKWVLSGTLHMAIPDDLVYFYIDATADGRYNQDGKYRLSVDGISPVTVRNWSSTTGTFDQCTLGAGEPMWGFKYGNGIAFSGRITDESWATSGSHRFILFSDGDPAVTKVISGISLSSHESVNLTAPMANNANGWTQYMTAPDFVEIAGQKWAKWNLGAASESDVTNKYLFRWSGLVPNIGNSEFGTMQHHSMTGDYVLFDPARAILGANWRMPSCEDFAALSDNCSLTSTNDYFTFTSQNDGTKSLRFLTTNVLYNVGGSIYLWTSDARDGTIYANVVEYHVSPDPPAFNIVSEGTGDSSRRALGENFIRPIYIGPDLDFVNKEGYVSTEW